MDSVKLTLEDDRLKLVFLLQMFHHLDISSFLLPIGYFAHRSPFYDYLFHHCFYFEHYL